MTMPAGIRPWPPIPAPFAPQPGLAPTREWATAGAVLLGIVLLFLANPFLAVGSPGIQVALLVTTITVVLPLGMASWVAWKYRNYRVQDLYVIIPAGLIALPAGVMAAIGTMVSVTATLWMMRARKLDFIPWWGWLAPKSWGTGVINAVITGVIIGTVLTLMGATDGVQPHIGMGHLLAGMADAMKTEAGLRLFMLALTFFVLGGVPVSRAQDRVATLMMVVPSLGLLTARHIAAANWLGMAIEGVLLLAFFIMPFVRLLKHYGIAPALIGHTVATTIYLAALSGS